MSLDKAMKDLKFDNRLLEQNLVNGSVKQDELKKHLENLPDSASNAGTVDIDDSNHRAEDQH